MAGYGSIGTDAHIKVQTEILSERAENAQTAISSMEKRLEEITQKINQMSGYWEGEAAEKAKRGYQKQQEVIQEILKQLKAYPDKLLTISGAYTSVEQSNQNESGFLRNDILG